MSRRKEDTLPEYIRRVAERKGLTMKGIAEKSGGKITQGYISQIINGKVTSPSVETIKALAAGLGVPISLVFKAACVRRDESEAA
jgi:transcriptional regulator with XRE-family HTH domain